MNVREAIALLETLDGDLPFVMPAHASFAFYGIEDVRVFQLVYDDSEELVACVSRVARPLPAPSTFDLLEKITARRINWE